MKRLAVGMVEVPDQRDLGTGTPEPVEEVDRSPVAAARRLRDCRARYRRRSHNLRTQCCLERQHQEWE